MAFLPWPPPRFQSFVCSVAGSIFSGVILVNTTEPLWTLIWWRILCFTIAPWILIWLMLMRKKQPVGFPLSTLLMLVVEATTYYTTVVKPDSFDSAVIFFFKPFIELLVCLPLGLFLYRLFQPVIALFSKSSDS